MASWKFLHTVTNDYYAVCSIGTYTARSDAICISLKIGGVKTCESERRGMAKSKAAKGHLVATKVRVANRGGAFSQVPDARCHQEGGMTDNRTVA